MSTIFIDTREKERPHPQDANAVTGTNMLALFQSHRSSPTVEPSFLNAGDFFFSGNGPDPNLPATFGIERKRLRDLLSSKRLGRISEQFTRMTDVYDFSFLVVEGVFRTNWHTGLLEIPIGRDWGPLTMGRQTFVGLEIDVLMEELAVCGNVRVKRTKDPKETVEYVMSLHHTFTTKTWDNHESCVSLYQPAEFASVVKSSDVRRVAFALRCGVGWEKSKTVEENFSSVDAMCAASPSDWAKLPGFGKVLGNKLYQALHGAPYNHAKT